MKLRFSVKALMVIVTLVAVAAGIFGVWLDRARRQRDAVAALRASGVSLAYDYEGNIRNTRRYADPFSNSPDRLPSPFLGEIGPVTLWLGRQLGRDFVCDIREVYASQPLPPDLVRRLDDIRSIESLHLNVRQHINVRQPFSDEAWQALLACHNVERLKLDRDQFNPTRRLAGLAAWQQLRSLTVEGGEFNLADAQEVAQLANLNQLTLHFVDTTDAALAPLSRLQQLEVFELTHAGLGQKVTAGGVAFLADLPQLRVLTLARLPSINDEICALLEKMPRLVSLNVDQARLQGTSFERLAGLTNLKKLNLIGTQVDDMALEKLSRLTQLEDLDLNFTQITDIGVLHLDSLDNLRMLRLGGNQLTDAGFASLAKLKSLEELVLASTNVTDAGLKQLGGLTKLRTLWLGSDVKVSPEAVAELKKQLPNCQIIQN